MDRFRFPLPTPHATHGSAFLLFLGRCDIILRACVVGSGEWEITARPELQNVYLTGPMGQPAGMYAWREGRRAGLCCNLQFEIIMSVIHT